MRRFFSEISEAIRIAGEQLAAHKVRSFLTALGVIIGIVAVTLMGTAIKGIDKGFSDSMDMIGKDILYIQQWPWEDVGNNWAKYRNRNRIDLSMAERLNDYIYENPQSALSLAVPSTEAYRTILKGDLSSPGTQLIGTNGDFDIINTANLLHGRFFTQAESQSGQNVIILGFDVAKGLFPEGMNRALGETVKLARRNFKVIGVLEKQGSFLGLQSFDTQAILPLPALRKFYRWDGRNAVRVQVKEGESMDYAVDEIVGLIRRYRSLMPEEENDFEINRSEALEDQFGPVKQGIAFAGFFITGLALFVGAIGIMNITFVSVKERTREIGTRRAVGASRRAILLQFLFEAISICLLGGCVGLGISFLAESIVSQAFPEFPFTFSGGLVFIAFFLSVLVGIFSGIAPAWQAAQLDPATALRHE